MLDTSGSQAMLSQKLRHRKSPSAGNYDNMETASIDNLTASMEHVPQTANAINWNTRRIAKILQGLQRAQL